MTEHELDRWTTLVIAEAQGRSLTPAARAERALIEREQPELAGEASLWAEFTQLERPRVREQDDVDLIEAVLARAAVAEPPAQAEAIRLRSAMTKGPSAAIVLLALAACVVLGLALGELRERGGEAVDRRSAEPLGGAAMAVEPSTQLRVATPGRHRLADDECRRAGAGAMLCTRDKVRFRVEARSTDQHVAIVLDEGQLHVDATALATHVEITTLAGVIRTQGIVDLRFDPSTGALDVDVIEGEAELTQGNAKPVRLGMGAALSLMAASLAPAATPEPGLLPEPEPVPAPAAKAKPSAPTADELLAAAQQALAAGESTMAIERYQTLIDQYPESGAAQIGSVSLGRLLLRQGRASEALAAFDRYLATDAHALIEEARYGRIRALRELGRTAESHEAITAFLTAHPGSIHRERLEDWQTP
jgi:tetratricopeptide (TPR) repeat protein